jgi:hypothetical protein
MRYIETNNDNEIVFQHFYPSELTEEQKKKGYLVKEIQEPVPKEGFVPINYYHPDKGFWTEYQEAPKSKEEREELLEQDVSALKNKLSEMQKAMAEMSMTIAMKGGAN